MAGVELTVIDRAGGTASFWAQQTYPDAILADSVWTMLEGVLSRLSLTRSASGSDHVLVDLLRIVGHGAAGQQRMGDSSFTTNPRQIIGLDRRGRLMNRSVLMRLRGCFSANAVVELHGCNVAQGRQGAALVRTQEGLWGVRILASSIQQDAGTRGLDHLIHP